jgi:type I restriction enzyme S subunit
MAVKRHRSTLGDYFTLQRGTTYKSRLLGQPGPELLGLATIQRNGGFPRDSLQTYGGECPHKLLVQPGDLYVSLKDVTQSADLLGAVARLPAGHRVGRLTQDTVKLEPKGTDVPLDYLYWLLRTPQYRSHCRAHATGTTNLGLSREDFLAFPAPEPTAKQQRIADVLTALEEKTELNHRINDTLEAIARALFKSWFVDSQPSVRSGSIIFGFSNTWMPFVTSPPRKPPRWATSSATTCQKRRSCFRRRSCFKRQIGILVP